ncbi:hypothetical protein A5638_20210 [Mycolicibacterium fortuitum]|uniref:glycerate kinase family protein n=1 Tax=Mycolicibacterium fortuitum TaxID=1766 RepID=UPI0007ECFC18|nr:glycerate kinase [Mycolicibacterium fortuitum]OBJ95433.1 hypothetical protein A5638_20210 [Mycolicibacterium fortuitum]
MSANIPRIILAPDKFKGTLTAEQVATAMTYGCADAGIAQQCIALPVADGGDGSVDAALRSGWTGHQMSCTDAWGRSTNATVAIRDHRALVEVASICGLGNARPTPQQALAATSYGVGTVIRALLDQGIRDITLALGGSATTDGGVGMLIALGADLRDESGAPIERTAYGLLTLATMSTENVDSRLATTRLILACDVDVPLVGTHGAAEMFARQKGADAEGVSILSAALTHLAKVAGPALDKPTEHLRPGSGAAGGLGWAGLMLGAELSSGAELFLDMLDAHTRIAGAALVITGEGSLDTQSLRGKAPFAIASLAMKLGVPAVAIVGTNQLPSPNNDVPFADIVALDELDPTCAADPGTSEKLLRQVTFELVRRTLDATGSNALNVF